MLLFVFMGVSAFLLITIFFCLTGPEIVTQVLYSSRGDIPARGQIYMGAHIGVVEIHLRAKQATYGVGSGSLKRATEAS